MEKELLKISSKLLTGCPISPYIEDIGFKYKMGERNRIHLQKKLDELDCWLKNIVFKLREVRKESCKWEDDGEGNWGGSCGVLWTLLNDGPKENDMNYCPKCGKKLGVEV